MVNLRWFRKHQKIMLVVFGVILMAVFVLGSVLQFAVSSGGQASSDEIKKYNETVVQWSGGELSRIQIQRMLELHYATMNFQEALLRDSIERSSQGPLVRPISAIPETSVEDADRAIFARFMMAQYAHDKLGLVVSDTAVYDYLQALSGSEVELTQQYYVGIARSTNSQVGYARLHEYLKLELAAMRLEDIIGESFFISGSGAAPANVLDAWQAFLQNERQIECAVLEFNAADFLPQIKDEPTTIELRKIYDEGKSFDVDPVGERPGFKQPRQVQVEYVTAEASAFMDLAIQDVTPEQVLAEYNRLVEAKDPLVMEPIPAIEKDPGEKLDGEKLEDAPLEELKDNMDESNDPAPTPDAGKLDPSSPETPPSEKAPDAGEGNQPSDPPKNAETDKDGAPAPSGSTEDGSGGVRLRSVNELQFVSLHRAPQELSQTPNPQEETKKDEPEPKPTEPAIPETSQDSEPAGDAAQDASAQQAELKQESPPDAPDSAMPPVSPAQEPTERAKKLDAALELAIKQRLKREEANERLSLAVEKARDSMNDYALELSDYESMKNAPDAENVTPPKPLDLKEYAAEHHLKYGKTELCTYEELVKEPVGMATEFQQNPTTGQFGTRRAADDLFINYDRRRLFEVQEINSIGDRYLYWLTAKADSRIPSFESARNDVISFWKKQKSIELAKSAAEKVKGDLRTSGKRLVDEHKDNAKLTGGFRWFQPSFNQINYGAPKGVRNSGEAFMSVAFGLMPDDVGVAINDDRTAAYVIQLIAGDPRSDEQLRDQFLDHIATVRQVIPSATNTFYNRKSIDKLIRALNEELKVEWIAY